MSDHSNSTGSSGSSTNSWTLLSPEEAAVENVGPVDDGTESLGDVPSLCEDLTGAAASDMSIETVLSEEGHQVCQETSPESSEGPIPSSPTRRSPPPPAHLDPPDLDLESQPPVIHDIVTSSPGDNEPLGATPFVTSIEMGPPFDVPTAHLLAAEPEESCPDFAEGRLDTAADIGPIGAEEGPIFTPEPEVFVPTETLSAADPPRHVEADISLVPETLEPQSRVPESLESESPVSDGPEPETVGSVEEREEQTEPFETQYEREEEEPSGGFDFGDAIGVVGGPRRRRNILSRTSDEDEEEEEEVEFKLAKKKEEEKPWLSLNKCIVGSLILLFLGSLFLSGDFDASELSDGEQSQETLSSDPQDMKELLDKLTQENQQIAQLEAQLQSQKEELDSALRAVAASDDDEGKADLEKENVKLKEELSSLPELKKELETLRARLTELSQLTADQKTPPSSAPQPADKDGGSNQEASAPERRKDSTEGGRLKEELKRQKVLLEESKRRLQGMKGDGGDRRRVRDSLEEIQKKLSEQVERWGKKKPQEARWKGNKEGRKKDEKRGEKELKHSKEGGWREKEEKEWKPQKQNSHKEVWRRHQDEWERRKEERRVDREERRREKPWHSRPGKNQHHQHHQHKHSDFWRDQEQKLRRNIRRRPGCSSVEDCASQEGLYPVELPEFEELLEGYLSKLEGSSPDSKDKIRKLTAEFFEDGGFIHDRVLFSDFAEDVADILEDMADLLEDGDSLEEEMEEFEREALWKFAATV